MCFYFKFCGANNPPEATAWFTPGSSQDGRTEAPDLPGSSDPRQPILGEKNLKTLLVLVTVRAETGGEMRQNAARSSCFDTTFPELQVDHTISILLWRFRSKHDGQQRCHDKRKETDSSVWWVSKHLQMTATSRVSGAARDVIHRLYPPALHSLDLLYWQGLETRQQAATRGFLTINVLFLP